MMAAEAEAAETTAVATAATKMEEEEINKMN